MFGTKKLIQQYEARIAGLERHIEDLRKLVHPQAYSQAASSVAEEADAIMSGQDQVIYESVALEPSEEIKNEISERDRILSGTY